MFQVATALPTTAGAYGTSTGYQALFPLQSSAGNAVQYNQFVFFSLGTQGGDPRVGGADTLYVVNSNAQNGLNASIDKYSYNPTTQGWSETGSYTNAQFAAGFGSAYGLTGQNNGSTVNLFFTTTQSTTGENDLRSLTDTSGYGQPIPVNAPTSTLVSLNTAANQVNPNDLLFKGLTFVPTTPAVVTLGTSSPNFTEGGSPVVVNSGLSLSDIYATSSASQLIDGATIQIGSGFQIGDVLALAGSAADWHEHFG